MIANEASIDEPAPELRSALDEDCTRAAQCFAQQAVTEPANKKQVIFNESFRISTYLYAIVAGPFGYHER